MVAEARTVRYTRDEDYDEDSDIDPDELADLELGKQMAGDLSYVRQGVIAARSLLLSVKWRLFPSVVS